MSKVVEVQQYRDKQTLKLIEGHKDIINKTWKVLEKDVLDAEIENAGDRKNATESLFWDKLAKRRKGLNEVESSLEKIEKLERTLSDYNPIIPTATTTNGAPVKETPQLVHPSLKHKRV